MLPFAFLEQLFQPFVADFGEASGGHGTLQLSLHDVAQNAILVEIPSPALIRGLDVVAEN